VKEMKTEDKNILIQTKPNDERLVKVKDSTDMAVERTLMAADRSLMAWVRTGLSLISFGFTIYKFLDNQDKQLQAMGKSLPDISSPKLVGLLMIGLGILSLVLGTVENLETLKSYRRQFDIHRARYALFISGIVTLIGIVLFLGILFKLNGLS
jgi:putative membrane protein